MGIFDDLIAKTLALLPPDDGKGVTSFPDTTKHIGRKGELILGRELGYELGGENKACSIVNLYTEDKSLALNDEVIIYGKDIYELKEDTAFARITIIRTEGIFEYGEQAAYNILENIGLKKYDVYPKGYMVRTSVLSNREQARVSKEAIKDKLSFYHVGKMYIDQFHHSKYVKAVKMIFITLPDIDYIKLDHLGTLSTDLFRTLNHAISDLKMDCKHCEWKLVCDEVEGMKELHQKMINK